MNMRTSTVAGVIFLLAGLMFFIPISLFDTEYDGIDNDRMDWSCNSPILDMSPPDVDIDAIRAQLAELPAGEKLESLHPECRKLARAQVALGLLAVLAGSWKTRVWWRETSDLRAERKFTKLQTQSGGKPRGLLG